MAVIVHSCPDCGHTDLDHPTGTPTGKNGCSYTWCGCQRSRNDLAASEPSKVILSFDATTGEPVREIASPGSRWHVNGVLLCGCANCRGLCDSLGGVAA